MKILWMTSEFPEFPGGAHHAWNYLLLGELAKRNHVTIAPLSQFPPAALKFLAKAGLTELKATQPEVALSAWNRCVLKLRNVVRRLVFPDIFYLWGDEAEARWKDVLTSINTGEYDVACVDHTGYANLLRFLPVNIRKIVVVANLRGLDSNGLPSRSPSLFDKLQVKYHQLWVARADLGAVQRASLAICMTQREKNWIEERTTTPVMVAPVVTDPSYFSQSVKAFATPGAGPWVVFTGSFLADPNVEAAIYFSTSVLPLLRIKHPDAGFLIVGSDPTAELLQLARNDDRIIVTGSVPDVRGYVAAADIYVAPLRYGAGIKIKMMEAMSMGKPIVATPLACDGLGVIHEQQVYIADGAVQFADYIDHLLTNKSDAAQLAANGQRFALQNFDYKVQVAKWESALANTSKTQAESSAASD